MTLQNVHPFAGTQTFIKSPFTCGSNSVRNRRTCLLPVQASDDKERSKGQDNSPEKLFQKELQKRGIFKGSKESKQRSGGKTSTSQTDPAPIFIDEKRLRSQLELSRKLNSEGLEGFIPRVSELLKLGFTFFLAFWPIILTLSLLTGGISWLYGENFIHGGRPSYFKRIVPDEVLNEPAFDKRVPFR